jgi:hypothetical protein
MLCKPSLAFLGVSLLALAIISAQSMLDGQYTMYCPEVGPCYARDVIAATFVKLTVIVFWTAVLHLLCSRGLAVVAWGLVAIPFAFFAIVVSKAVMIRQ